MTISYNWLSEYLPSTIDTHTLSTILTSIGLEVESMETYESCKGGLKGLVIGEVLQCEPHPNADKLKITQVQVGGAEPLQIVCGAANVAVGQKVVVATVGSTIYPTSGEPLTMRVAKIRGVESFGMLCAEDEIGLGSSHEGILVLPENLVPGTLASDYFGSYSDVIYEIGLTPNRMDAMSHLGVAKDVCAYLSYHQQAELRPKTPYLALPNNVLNTLPFEVTIENEKACPRYSGLSISGVTVGESPEWLKNRLQAIGLRPINNIVDVTNYVLHETGQPLHAFDAAAIAGRHIRVKNLPQDTLFVSLDGKERRLLADDLLICDNLNQPLCLAGVFGGRDSGVHPSTTSIFLESACFAAVGIRKTSVKHGLRTDAATRFEKGVDISNTVSVLHRAAQLILQVAGGSISSPTIDVYSIPKARTQVTLTYAYLTKLSGKKYAPQSVSNLLSVLGFEIVAQNDDQITVAVPFCKPDISLPADLVEEVIRIDGLDNITIPTTISISPSVEALTVKDALREKIATYLVGKGFNEIFTNSITNSKYFTPEVIAHSVNMLNSLSADLDVMRPSILETGLECLSYNINRRISNLQFFEFGKTYHAKATANYYEVEHLAMYITGNNHEDGWRNKQVPHDFFSAKGYAEAVLALCGIADASFTQTNSEHALTLTIATKKQQLGTIVQVGKQKLAGFDIKQSVYFIDFDYEALLQAATRKKITYKEVPKFPVVQRDLALVIDKSITYATIESTIQKAKLDKLQAVRLFDVFENDKLGLNKKSVAINFSFLDESKTLTDKETDSMMQTLIAIFEKDLEAIIRK